MIDNTPSPSKSIRPITVSEFLIWQIVHEDIHYFSYKFLSQAMKNKMKDDAAKLFNKLKHPFQLNILWFFSNQKKILPESDCELAEQPLVCSVPTKWTNRDEKETPSSHGDLGAH